MRVVLPSHDSAVKEVGAGMRILCPEKLSESSSLFLPLCRLF